jgi:hypothetical protein
MANKKIFRQGIVVVGGLGELFSVTDSFTGIIHSVSDISGIPIFKVEDTGISTFGGLVRGIGPVTDLDLATKKYVDDNSGGTGSVTSITAGNGMNFTTITATGTVTLGTPGSLSGTTTNAVTTTSHTHVISTGAIVDNATIPSGADVVTYITGLGHGVLAAANTWTDVNIFNSPGAGKITTGLNGVFPLEIDGAAGNFYIRFNTDATSKFGGLAYEDTLGNDRFAFIFNEDKVILSNRASNGSVYIKANNATAGSGGEVDVADFTATDITFGVNASGPGFFESSDERLKKNIVPLDDKFVSYQLKTDKEKRTKLGVVAQRTDPMFVRKDKYGTLSVDYTSLLVGEIVELKARVKELENKITWVGQATKWLRTLIFNG